MIMNAVQSDSHVAQTTSSSTQLNFALVVPQQKHTYINSRIILTTKIN